MSRQTLLRTIGGSMLAAAALTLAGGSEGAFAQATDSHGSTTPAIHVETTSTAPHGAGAAHVDKAGDPKHAKDAAHADHGDPAAKVTEINPVPFVFTIIIFIVLLIILRLTAWKPILAGLKAREESIRNSIEAAAKAKADAERTTKELEAKMAEAQRQGAMALQQAKDDALKLADSIRKQAEADSAALKDRTLRDIEAAKQQALSEINGRAADLGIAVARKILQREVNVTDQQRIVEESLAQLDAAKI